MKVATFFPSTSRSQTSVEPPPKKSSTMVAEAICSRTQSMQTSNWSLPLAASASFLLTISTRTSNCLLMALKLKNEVMNLRLAFHQSPQVKVIEVLTILFKLLMKVSSFMQVGVPSNWQNSWMSCGEIKTKAIWEARLVRTRSQAGPTILAEQQPSPNFFSSLNELMMEGAMKGMNRMLQDLQPLSFNCFLQQRQSLYGLKTFLKRLQSTSRPISTSTTFRSMTGFIQQYLRQFRMLFNLLQFKRHSINNGFRSSGTLFRYGCGNILTDRFFPRTEGNSTWTSCHRQNNTFERGTSACPL